MANFNKVILAGNLTRDPELRYTPKGTAIVKIGLAINRTWKNEAGESKAMIGAAAPDALVPNGCWFWGAADNHRLAVSNATQIAEKILAS